MVMVGKGDGHGFLGVGEEQLRALLGVVVLGRGLGAPGLGVLGRGVDAPGLSTVERRVWRRARAWAAVRGGEGVGVVVVGVWGGVGWGAISVLGKG